MKIKDQSPLIWSYYLLREISFIWITVLSTIKKVPINDVRFELQCWQRVPSLPTVLLSVMQIFLYQRTNCCFHYYTPSQRLLVPQRVLMRRYCSVLGLINAAPLMLYNSPEAKHLDIRKHFKIVLIWNCVKTDTRFVRILFIPSKFLYGKP